MGLPLPSARTCGLVLKPPRDRPKAWSPFFRPGNVLMCPDHTTIHEVNFPFNFSAPVSRLLYSSKRQRGFKVMEGGAYLSQSPRSELQVDGREMGELHTLRKGDNAQVFRGFYTRTTFGLVPILPATGQKSASEMLRSAFLSPRQPAPKRRHIAARCTTATP